MKVFVAHSASQNMARLRLVSLATLLSTALLTHGPAEAAGPARAPTLLDMSGVWERDTVRRNDHYDPNTAYGKDQTPPLNDEYMKVWKANFEMASKGDLSYDPSAMCLPKGFPRVMMAPIGMEILATSKQVNFYNEASVETVRVYLDGKQQRPDPDPSYIGFTTGTWANSVLTTKTVSLRGDTLFDVTGIPHSDALTVTQKIRFLDKDTLEDIVTSSDPKAFTKDWVVRMVYRREPPSRYVDEFVCQENNRGVSPQNKKQ